MVIAAAGLDPVESVEGARLGWDGVLARLVAALRPGGTLLLRLDNPLGLHRLVATTPWYAGRDDSAWTIGGVLDRTHPANRDQLRERLSRGGAAADARAGPRTPMPTPRRRCSTPTTSTGHRLRAASTRCCTAPAPGVSPSGTVLQDPARLAVDALHAGRAADLAPGWLTLAHRPADPADPTAPAVDRDLPVVLVQTGRPGIGVLEVLHGPSGWRWGRIAGHRNGPPAAAPFASREAAYRDAGALSGPVPAGRLLRTLLLDAALRRDLATLRALLRGYAGWLADQADADGRIAGAAALAGADNVVVDGERYAVLDPSWRATAALPADVVLARGLWRFAAALLTGGYAHPWPSTLDVAGLTVVLGGLAGHDLDRATVAEAVEAEAAIAAALHGLDADGTGRPRHRTARRRAHRPAGRRAQLPAAARGVAAPARGTRPAGSADRVDRGAAHLAGTGAAPGRDDDRPAQRIAQLPGRPARHHPGPAGQAGRPRRQAPGHRRARPPSRRSSSDRPDTVPDGPPRTTPGHGSSASCRPGWVRPGCPARCSARSPDAPCWAGSYAPPATAASWPTWWSPPAPTLVDDAVAAECARLDVPCHRGPVDDVLGRFVGALAAHPGDAVMRFTADCPLLDPEIITLVASVYRAVPGLDYASTSIARTLPRGLDVEIIRAETLRTLGRLATDHHRVHVTSYAYTHPELFRVLGVTLTPDRSALRLTLDTEQDWALVSAIVDHFGDVSVPLAKLADWLDGQPRLRALNADVRQKHLEES